MLLQVSSRSASVSPLLDGTLMPSKRRPSLLTLLSSKIIRAALITILILVTLLSLSHRFDSFQYPFLGGGPDATLADPTNNPTMDWSQFAYVQYVTDEEYLCNSVMMFEALHRLGSRPDRVMLYPSSMFPDPDNSLPPTPNHNETLLVKARDQYNVKLVPIEVLSRNTTDGTTPFLRAHLPYSTALNLLKTDLLRNLVQLVHQAPRFQSHRLHSRSLPRL